MPSAREHMKTIDEELDRVRAQLDRLKHEEEILLHLKARMSGESAAVVAEPKRKARSPSIKPLVLQLIHEAGAAGMSSADVAATVKDRVPDVAKDTVGSVLSRLKSEGAFAYENDRYFERQYAPSRIAVSGKAVSAAGTTVN